MDLHDDRRSPLPRLGLAETVLALRDETDRYLHVLDLLSREDPTGPAVLRNVMLVSSAHGVTLNALVEDLEAATAPDGPPPG